MKLTKSAYYAIRTLMELASHHQVHTMPVLAAQLGIPYNHLSKVVQTLSRSQLIQTRQGKFGGIYLARPATDITLKDVIITMDGAILFSECMNDAASGCDGNNRMCKLKQTFFNLQGQMEQSLAAVSLADLL